MVVVLVGCGKNTNTTPEIQIATVQRGNLQSSITGTGNLNLARTSDLAFEIAGAVHEVLVDEGDTVTEGQTLVSLDTTVWDEHVNTLDKALTTAQRSLKNAERQITAKELAVRQAELNLLTAQANAAEIPAVKAAQDIVDSIEVSLKTARTMYATNPSYWAPQIESLNQALVQARQNLQEVLRGTSLNLTGDVALQIQKIQLQVEQSERQLEDAKIAVDDAIITRDDAEQTVIDAEDALNEAKSLSPLITAPFTGFVIKISVKGGDNVQKGVVAVQIADPAKFKADILVGESDIFQVALGGDATVQVDAMSSLILPAKINWIAPTATVQQGVVNYKVTVEIQSTTPVTMNQSQIRPGTDDNVTTEQLSERLQQAVKEGRMTQEQADAIIKQMQEGGPSGGLFGRPDTSGQQSPFGQGAQIQDLSSSINSLKQGMSVTVDIITAQRTNVILVPNNAIVRRSGATYVSVIKDGVTEQRQVTCGVSDWQNTEVIEGLNQGEEVLIVKTTSSSSSFGQGGQFGFPGGGGMVITR
jgi:HlyD family secretion protein